jgi:hypothetical protein
MATWDDVRRIALALPETEETTKWHRATWVVGGKGFVWERPLSKVDHKKLGDAAPEGPILGVRVENLVAKESLLAQGPPFFTIPHFDGYPAVLVLLDEIDAGALEELVEEAWLSRAPDKLAQRYVDDN